MSLRNNYYASSFFWSTFQKVLNAIVGFISVPLLLGYYGRADYGILGIATACNGYMHLLDLGMNSGAVKFFSQWEAEGKRDLVNRVARTNITFYGIIAVINILGLVALAVWGESLFSVTHEQFHQLRTCLFIIALFCLFSWGATTYRQLLVANLQMAYTMKVQTFMTLFKGILIGAVFLFELSLTQYFFLLTGVVAMLIVPYSFKCKKLRLIESIKPAAYWSDFKVVITFSLSLFALSLFQMTATHSRPIILSMFAEDGAARVAEFNIVGVIPGLIITIGGTFSGLFLPKTSAMVASRDQSAISMFAYKWTKYTSIIVNILTVPFVLCSSEVLSAYVGEEYEYLSIWLIIWCLTVLVQMHTTPGNALVLAYGKTSLLVLTTACACIASIILNICLTSYYGVGSAIISYFLYVLIVIGLYYFAFYKQLLKLSRYSMFMSFLKPTILSFVSLFLISYISDSYIDFYIVNDKVTYITISVLKTCLWLVSYIILLFTFRVITLKEIKKM